MRSAQALLVLFAMLTFSHPAAAQTLSYADAMQRLATNCGADIQKFCKNESLGGDRLRNCLTTNQAKVSPQCKSGWSDVFASLMKRATAQASIFKVCSTDIQRYCGLVNPGDGQILDCMLKAQNRVSATCRQTALDAGWM